MKNASILARHDESDERVSSSSSAAYESQEFTALNTEDLPSSWIAAKTQIIRWLALLWNVRRFLAKATAVGLVSGAVLAFLLPVRYQSSVELMPPDSQSSTGMAMLAALTAKTGNGLGAIAGDMLGLKSSGALFVGILRSRTVEDRLVQRFDLKKTYGTRFEDEARQELGDRTGISEDRKSGIITIAVQDRDPKRAAAMAQAYLEELDRLVAELSTSSAHRERVFLEERLRDVKQDLDQASTEFSQFSSKNVAIDVKEQGRAMVEETATLQGQLIAAESEQKALEEIYTPNNVRARAASARVAELRQQLKKLGGSDDEAATTPGTGASGTSNRGDSLYPSLRQLPLLGVQYADLYRRTKIEEVIYETLTQQYELAKVQEARETPSVKVLDAAEIPERKTSPKRLSVMLLCGVFALAGAMVWSISSAKWKQADEADPGKQLARQIFHSVNKVMPWSPPNGSRFHNFSNKAWTRLARGSRDRQNATQ